MNQAELLKEVAQAEMMKLLGIEIQEASGDQVVLTMPVTPSVHQYTGIMNGGISLLLAETAASIGAVLKTDLTKQTPVGIEINANHLRSVSKGTVTVTAKPVYHGRTVSVWQVEIRDRREKLICISRCTLSLKKGAAFPQNA
ncbi:MAG TPA: hotdog fold thioesterase [Pyrinomonadaceae bacterium]|nr:hotdog fold thioesterase [Pyrinomonadaceae bacterium]